MTKQFTVLIFIALILLTGCSQPTLADSGTKPGAEPVATNVPVLPTATPEPVTIIGMPPTITAVPTTAQNAPIIPSPPPTSTPTATLFPKVLLNGLAPESFIYFSPEVAQHSQQILAHGQTLGRNPRHFSKIGDSIVDTEQFFAPFDEGNYSLGEYEYLAHATEYYAGSYGRFGFALREGLSSTAVMDPMWADKEQCIANETPLACEIRLHNSSLILIHFGTNDWTGTFEANMRQIVEYAIQEGVVPVLITKANRVEANNDRNDILRSLAVEYRIPLWDFDIIAATLPERGLAPDNAHLSISTEFDYTQSPPIYQGYKAFNLSGLMFLDAFIRGTVNRY